MLQGVGVKAQALIKSEQPFNEREPEKSTLWRLEKLSNWDKHRTIALTAWATSRTELQARQFGDLKAIAIRPNGPFKDDTPLGYIEFGPSDRPFQERVQEMNMQAAFTFAICFEQPEAMAGEEVVAGINTIGQRVQRIGQRIDKEILSAP
jgi:hypothetical protein